MTHLAIISSHRAANVPKMEHVAADLNPVWYVGEGELGNYDHMGAGHVIEAGGLIEARNMALDNASGRDEVCIQISDDARKMAWAETTTKVSPLSLTEAVAKLEEALNTTGAQLAGAAPTANPFFSKARIHETAFIVGDFIGIAPGCPLRFDPKLTLKEDYDYTVQHLTEYGKVARVDQLMATFLHGTNRGGAVDYRTETIEDENIGYLMKKWPGCFRPNPRRPHEILLTWPAKKNPENH